MWPPVRWKPALSLTFAMTLFTLNYRSCDGNNKDTKERRHRKLFNILTGTDVTSAVNVTETRLKMQHDVMSNDVEDIRDTIRLINTDKLILPNVTFPNASTHAVAKPVAKDNSRKEQPPLVSGKETIITLSLLGKFRKTWCKTEPFMQVIKEPGCVTRKVMNRFCYGQCNSFYIPRTLRKGKKQNIFKSCGFCKPRRTHKIRVTLVCPGKRKGYKHKRVRQIKTCRCTEGNVS